MASHIDSNLPEVQLCDSSEIQIILALLSCSLYSFCMMCSLLHDLIPCFSQYALNIYHVSSIGLS